MTARTTRSRKSNIRAAPQTGRGIPPPGPRRLAARGLWAAVLALAPAALLGAAPARAAAAQAAPRLPVIQNVGVVPVQWEGEAAQAAGRAAVDEAFPKSVRAARRFRVLSDDLVSGLWKDAAGRAELRGQFELHGYLSLTVAPRGDLLSLTARLMDSWLKTELLETDTVSADWLASADPKATAGRLEGLVFRLLNRLPVDVSVTSVQGAYITLSGGIEQGVEPGDKVDLVRTAVRGLHPANGTWLEFQSQPLGTAQVIDVKTYTSVARLTNLTYDGAVEVGDGARIAAIATRVRFARLAANGDFHDAGDQGTIIVPPLYSDAPAKPAPAAAPPSAAPAPKAVAQGEAPAAAAPVAADEPAAGAAPPPAIPPPDAPPPEDAPPSLWDDVATDVSSHRLLDSIDAYAGPYWWSVKGPTNSSGKFPPYLVNSLGGGVTRTLLYKIKTAFTGGLLMGKTDDGDYVGYDATARIFWEEELHIGEGMLKGWRAGGLGRLSGIAVSPGSYGGGDWLRGGGFGGLFGSLHAGQGDRYDWFGEFSITPLNIGRIGYEDSRKQVQSSFGYAAALGAFKYQPARTIQWGGGFYMSDETETLSNDRVPHYQEFSLRLLAKYAL